MPNKYKLTINSCILAIMNQAIIANLLAILFIPLKNLHGLTYTEFGVLVGLNFVVQFLIDLVFSGLIDKIGYKKIVLPTCILSSVGLITLALSSVIFKNNIFIGVLIATIIFSASGGLAEILLSPLVDACTVEGKGQAMSNMHSFYAWGQIITIVITTLFLFFVGEKFWQIITLIWAISPIVNFFMFLKAEYPETVAEERREKSSSLIKKPYFIFCLTAILFGGASEIVMNQWTSTLMVNALNIPKVWGDLIGMCGFAFMLGLGRTIYSKFGDKFDLNKLLCVLALLTFVCYLTVALVPITWVCIGACIICGLTASLLWPGTIVLASERFPYAGAWMFAILAMFGDFGGAIAPTLTGAVVDISLNGISNFLVTFLSVTPEEASLRFGMLLAGLFPLLCFVSHFILVKIKKLPLDKKGNNVIK